MQGCVSIPGSDRRTSYLFLGDCLDVLALLPDKSVDCIIADPPYGIHYHSRSHSLPLDKMVHDDESAHDLLDKALSLAHHKLKENSHIYIFTSWQTLEPTTTAIKKYFTLENVLVWVKNNRTRGDLKGNYGYQHEMVLYAQNGRRHLAGTRDANILHFDKVPSVHMQHPTEKPVKLLEYFIEKSTSVGETVLDMFMGSGSTCLAAKNLKRNYIGIEIEPVWYRVARSRLEERAL